MQLDIEVDPVLRVVHEEGRDRTVRGFVEEGHLCAEDCGVFVGEGPVVGYIDLDAVDLAVFALVVVYFAGPAFAHFCGVFG